MNTMPPDDPSAPALPLDDPSPPVLPPLGQLVEDMPMEVYMQVDAINASGLKTLLRSPAHYWHERHVAPRAETAALRFGSLVHAAVLEPERTAHELVVRPDFNMRTNAGKAAREAWEAEQPATAIVCSAEEHARMQAVLASVQSHPMLMRLMASGVREAGLFWRDPDHSDVLCKARYDFVSAKTRIIVDIKTTQDARWDPFSRDLIKFQYGLSAAHYLEGARRTGVAHPDRFVIVAVEKEPPFGIMLYELDYAEIERSRGWWGLGMRTYAKCVADKHWPCYRGDFVTLEAPPWAPPAPAVL